MEFFTDISEQNFHDAHQFESFVVVVGRNEWFKD